METTVKIDRGLFLWYELMTSDKKAALRFYRKVIGWDTQDWDSDQQQSSDPYTMWMAGETPVGGVMQIDKTAMPDVPPHWLTYISTPDVDASVKKAKDLEASVVAEPFDVPEVGRMAVLSDPQGAVFAVYKPSGQGMEMKWPPQTLSFSWNELATTDYKKAVDFYQQLFGWEKTDQMDMGDGWMYQMYGHGDRTYGGIYNKPPDQPGPPAWLFYIKVDDINAAVDRVKQSGGQILNGPMEVPGGDLVAQAMDPQGAAFALHQSKQ